MHFMTVNIISSFFSQPELINYFKCGHLNNHTSSFFFSLLMLFLVHLSIQPFKLGFIFESNVISNILCVNTWIRGGLRASEPTSRSDIEMLYHCTLATTKFCDECIYDYCACASNARLSSIIPCCTYAIQNTVERLLCKSAWFGNTKKRIKCTQISSSCDG